MVKSVSTAIIGAGPAGIAAVIQLKRYGIPALIFERDSIGGLLRNANWVENYPGFAPGISGVNLIELFKQQLHNLDIHPVMVDVTQVKYEDNFFLIYAGSGIYRSERLIVASGTKPVKVTEIGIPAEVNDRIFYEVYPLLGSEGKEIAIIGAGDAAFDYALNLAKHNRIFILNRSDIVQCLQLLYDRAESNFNIQYMDHTRINQIIYGGSDGLMLELSNPEGILSLKVDYLVGAIGRVPNTDFLSEQIFKRVKKLQAQGRLYLIGDVKNEIYRQVSIAVGDGIKAAMQIYQWEKGMIE